MVAIPSPFRSGHFWLRLVLLPAWKNLLPQLRVLCLSRFLYGSSWHGLASSRLLLRIYGEGRFFIELTPEIEIWRPRTVYPLAPLEVLRVYML